MVRFIFRVTGGAVKGWTEVGTTAIIVLGKRGAGPGLTTHHCKQATTRGRRGEGGRGSACGHPPCTFQLDGSYCFYRATLPSPLEVQTHDRTCRV